MAGLNQFLRQHMQTEGVLHEEDDQSPPWWQEGTTVEIKEETYYEKLDMLPPRYMDGSLFAFGEGAGNFSLFWKQSGKFYTTHLSQADTETFCRLAGVGLHI